jgi:hypothetical protein
MGCKTRQTEQLQNYWIFMKERIANDFYPTERKITESLLRKLSLGGSDFNILEPCNGQGHISRVLKANLGKAKITTSDLTDGEDCDATKRDFWAQQDIDWVVTNPPFSQAALIVPLAHEFSRSGIAMLLRLSWLEPCGKRAAFLKAYPPTQLIVFNPRPKFRSDCKGTDSVTTAWFIWEKLAEGSRATEITFDTEWKS